MKREELTDLHTREICRVGQGAKCCRYLTMDGGGWSCEKHTGLGRFLDRRVEAESINARGDNCGGVTISE